MTQPSPTPNPFAQPLKIRYNGSAAYLGFAAHWLIENQRVYAALAARERRTAWLMAILTYAVVATVAVLWITSTPLHPEHERFYVFLAFLLPVLVSMFVLTRRAHWRDYHRANRAQAKLRLTPDAYPDYQSSYDATEEGMRTETGDAIHIDRWSRFEDVVAIDHAVMLLGADRYLVLPSAALGDAAAVDHFVADVERILLDANLHRSQRVRALLAQPVHGMGKNARWRCWRCAYELSPEGFAGAQDPRCPECGLRLSEHTLRAGAAVDYPIWRWLLMHLSPGGSRRTIQWTRSGS